MNFSLVVKLIKLSPGEIHRIAADFFANTYMHITYVIQINANSLFVFNNMYISFHSEVNTIC